MRIVIAAVGSYGDVAPYTGLARNLDEAGAEVAIATHSPFEPFVRAAGLEFLPLSMDPSDALASEAGQRATGTSLRALRHSINMIADHQRALGQDMLAAAQGADVLLLSPMAWLGWHVAQGLGIPSAGVYLQPWTPTSEFAPPALTTRSFGSWGNRSTARVLRLAGQRPARGVINELRRQIGLPATTPRASFDQMEATQWPIYYGFSPTVVPPPSDWPSWHQVVGYWWPVVDPQWEAPRALVEFLAEGSAPVFLGFGSMHVEDPTGFRRMLIEAVDAAGVRAVIQHPDSRVDMHDGDVLGIGSCPHAWLFPQMAAVVHHCGAGTTAAGLRAGVPTVPVPVMVDQPFWAARIHALGVAAKPIPMKNLTAHRLASAIATVIRDRETGVRAQTLAAKIHTEDGYTPVARALGLL